MNGSGSDPSRTPRRRSYPLTAYLPFALIVAVPLLLLTMIVALVVHVATPSSPPATPAGPTAPTPSPLTGNGTPLTIVRSATPTVRAVAATPVSPATATLSARAVAVLSSVRSFVIARGVTSAGQPLGAAIVFHGAPQRLWAVVDLSAVHRGDRVRLVWSDRTRKEVIEDFTTSVTAAAAPYHLTMFAFPGSTPQPATPFPPHRYAVDLYVNGLPSASRSFSVVTP